MQYIVNGASFTSILAVSGSAAGDVISYTVYTSAGASFSTGTPTNVAGTAWKVTFTPTTLNETYTLIITDTTSGTTATETFKSTGVIGTVWDATSGAVGSSVGIANIALSKIGVTRITSFSENVEQARLLSAIYGTIRDEVLRAHPWNFAIARTAPSLAYSLPDAWAVSTAYVVGDYVLYSNYPYRCLVAHTSSDWTTDLAAGDWVADTTDWIPYEYSYSFTIPTDCLRVLDVTDGTNRVDDFKVEDGKILCDYDTIYIRYIYRVTDSTDFDANFISCFATRLAAECCFPLTSKADVAKLLKEEYTEEIRKAKAIDGQESGIVDESGKDEFITARY